MTTTPTPRRSPRIPSSVELAADLRLSATRLARQLRRQSESGLTPSLLSALSTIERRGPVTLGTLAECEGVAPPSITKIAAKLEAEGLVERQLHERDRRIVHVVVVPAGTALLEESRARKDAWLAARIQQLDPDQRARLAGALDVLDELASGTAP